jgi:hypothetical protein
MGSPRPRPVVLDAGALIGIDRGKFRVRTLVRRAMDGAARVVTGDAADLRRLDPDLEVEAV